MLNNFENYGFVLIILGDFTTAEKLPKNHFMLISLIFLRSTMMKKLIEFL